jgi:DNA-binding GntR family transcriptional regulator
VRRCPQAEFLPGSGHGQEKMAAGSLGATTVADGKYSIAEKAYQALRSAIVECRLSPEERLTEASIARQLRVGKTPAREALRRLVVEGLARVTPRHGYTVSPITLRDVQELFALRLLVEPAAAALAAGNPDKNFLVRLKKLSRVGYREAERDSLRKFVRANTEFHAQIALLSGNRRFAQLVSQLLSESERLINFGALLQPQSERTVNEHQRLIEALASGDAASARRTMEEHVRTTRQMVVESLLSDERLCDVSISSSGRDHQRTGSGAEKLQF